MSSPEKKRMKYDPKKVQCESLNVTEKQQKHTRSAVKTETERQMELKTMKKKNFVIACEKVSCEAYLNRQKRLQILNWPTCAKSDCSHLLKQETIREMPCYATETFNIEIKSGMWFDALEVCQVNISCDQYLSAEVMKEILEIILNAHDDSYVNYTVEELIDKCQQVLSLNFSSHPPCSMEIRKCYENFLTTPMDLKGNTFTNRMECGCDDGIIKYCMNRLEHDINAESDEPLVKLYENTPFEMKEGVQGLHWQKEKFEIFEGLKRPERIKRVMAVLESTIELLQYDLAIWLTRHTRNLGRQIMNLKKRPLLAILLWPITANSPTQLLNTGSMTKNCRQIVDLFIYVIHLQYPEEHIQVMTTWLNTMIEIIYICETNSDGDYPNIGKYCYSFATKFYECMTNTDKCLSNDSIIHILERIQPSFMKYLIGMHVTKSFIRVKEKEDNVIRILIDYIEKCKKEGYPECSDIQVSKQQSSSTDKTFNMLLSLMEQCRLDEVSLSNSDNNNNNGFLKISSSKSDYEVVSAYHVVHVLYVTIEALLDAYSVKTVQETLNDLNNKLLQDPSQPAQVVVPTPGIYSVSVDYIKKYRTIFMSLQELIKLKQEMMEKDGWPEVLNLFNDILE
ncbi:uncharacterized protein LOC125226166 [Leguminivora glycinivorella]|uniref:uncharacterized protein LOC125226166 n=1 Tax=Leguminivora glycinivorella TaxID=1035111 RepID=UPI00200D7F92|nr:uncharacterized protein LOC125226166 [Leguminivora glycinivorella]